MATLIPSATFLAADSGHLSATTAIAAVHLKYIVALAPFRLSSGRCRRGLISLS